MISKDTRIYTFIGKEGAGKTKTAKALADVIKKPYISTGDICRDRAQNDYSTHYGDACRQMFAENTYLDPKMILELLGLRLTERDTSNGFVVDGSMRTVDETKNFPKFLKSINRLFPMRVYLLDASSEICIERLTKPDGRKRDGETPESVAKLHKEYEAGLEARIAIIKSVKNWEIFTINANGTLDNTISQVLENIQTR